MKKIIFVIIILTVAVVGITAYIFFGRPKKPNYNYAIAKKSEIIQKVSVTGKVKPAQSIDLAFEKSGKVVEVWANVGDKIEAGQILVRLDSGELSSQLLQAQANLESEQAKLKEMQKGVRAEEIKIAETQVENAKINIEEAQKNLVDKIRDAYVKSDDAVRNYADNLFLRPQNVAVQLKLPLADGSLRTEIEQSRYQIENALNKWQISVSGLTVKDALEPYTAEAKNNLNQIFELLNNLALAVNTASANGISQATLDTYKTYISTARTNLNTAITGLTTAEEKLKISQSSLSLAENELALKKAGALNEQITAQEARVKASQANVQNYQVQIAKTILRSPIKGIVTRQDAKVGQIVTAQTIIASVISAAKFQIETNISEADIAKIKIGDKAEITLDAYGDDFIFQGEVVAIDPAGKIIEGVAAYKVTLQFTTEDSRLKPEMTANIDIFTARLKDVIIIPRRAIITENGKKFVEILNEKGNIQRIEVNTGIIGSDGNIEIKEGLKEGDKVIVFRQ